MCSFWMRASLWDAGISIIGLQNATCCATLFWQIRNPPNTSIRICNVNLQNLYTKTINNMKSAKLPYGKKYVYLSPQVRVLVRLSTCTYPHKSVYLSDPFPEGGARGALWMIIIIMPCKPTFHVLQNKGSCLVDQQLTLRWPMTLVSLTKVPRHFPRKTMHELSRIHAALLFF